MIVKFTPGDRVVLVPDQGQPTEETVKTVGTKYVHLTKPGQQRFHANTGVEKTEYGASGRIWLLPEYADHITRVALLSQIRANGGCRFDRYLAENTRGSSALTTSALRQMAAILNDDGNWRDV